jgi:hypothetical protein
MSSNPFATRYIRPGAQDYIFPPGSSAGQLVETLRQNNWCGQIIGPHGSGKSTLIAAIIPALESAGRKVIHCRMSNVEGRTSDIASDPPTFDFRPRAFDPTAIQLDATTQLVIDGYEQLSWLQRRSLVQRCNQLHSGLLVTAHRDMNLPMLIQIEPSLELTRAVVARLLLNERNSITAEDIASAYQAASGNIRETLFRLFDVYQERSQRSDIKAED